MRLSDPPRVPRRVPWSVRFAKQLTEPAVRARESLGGTDARTLARELVATTQAERSAAFEGAPMKRARRHGLARNAAVTFASLSAGASGNPSPARDRLPSMRTSPRSGRAHARRAAPVGRLGTGVREHVAWALLRLGDEARHAARRGYSDFRYSTRSAFWRAPRPSDFF
jgi:epoxyqueuosine reductase QueG